MARTFRVLIHGENFILMYPSRFGANHPLRVGFYTNRFIQTSAESLSPSSLNQLLQQVKGAMPSLNSEENPPEVMIHQIWELSPTAPKEDTRLLECFFLYPEDVDAYREWMLSVYRSASYPHDGKKYRIIPILET